MKKLAALLISIMIISSFASIVKLARASGTIYIRADGSIDPPTAPISDFDNATYTLTGNIISEASGIVIERSNIIVDGQGCTIRGPGFGNGINMSSTNNVTIKNTNIANFMYGIRLDSSFDSTVVGNNVTGDGYCGIFQNLFSSQTNIFGNNIMTNVAIGIWLYGSDTTVFGNNVTNNGDGIWLEMCSNSSIFRNNIVANNYIGINLLLSSNCTVFGNNIIDNYYGIRFFESSSNFIYHNDLANTIQVYDVSWDHPEHIPSVNIWDDGYPSGGNYWSDYTGIDANRDGIGDTPYVIDANNQDRYPLMSPVAKADSWPMFRHDLNHTGYSSSIGPTTSQVLWNYTTGALKNTGDSVDSSPAVVSDRVYVGSANEMVQCLNATTGALIWDYRTAPTGEVHSSPAVFNGLVYVGSMNSHDIYCLNATTGTLVWNYTTGSGVQSSPAVSYGYVYVGSYDHNVYCLTATTGQRVWRFGTGDIVGSSPAIARGLVYVGSHDKNVYCLNAFTGGFIWEYSTDGPVDSSPSIINGLVYVGSRDNSTYCLNATTGTRIWSYKTGGSVVSSPAVVDGLVYVGSTDNNVYCLNASNGTKVWNYATGSIVWSSPAVVDHLVYVGSCDHNVYCLNATNGARVWNYTTGHTVYSSPAVADGKLFIGSDDGKVYAFGGSFAPAKFSLGEEVEVIGTGTSGLLVRDSPAGYLIGKEYDGSQGIILAGPQNASLNGIFYNYWKVLWNNGVFQGWSAENWLGKVSSKPPNSYIKLQSGGVQLSQVGVGEFFDINAAASTSDKGITQIRFSNDDVRDGKPTGLWTQWYDWSVSSTDWNANTKIRRWAFYSSGYKEVWAEVKDQTGQTATCSASIYSPAPALPVLVSQLVISPVKDLYTVGDSLTAQFTVRNMGDTPITLDKLTVGGRLDGWIKDGYPDFTYRQVTLQPNVDYQYSGSLTLSKVGSYRFFVAYNIANPSPDEKKLLDENNWNTCIELGEGLTQTSRVINIVVYETGTLPGEPEALRQKVGDLLSLNPYVPPNLLDADSWKEKVANFWGSLTSWATQTDLTGQYKQLYNSGINYLGLRLKALNDANSALDRGNIEDAQKCVEKSRLYDKLASMSFTTAIDVYDGNLDAGATLAEGIRNGCETAVKFGVDVLFPSAGIAADGMYLITNFGFDTWIEGMDPAAKNMAINAAFTLIFQTMEFPSLDSDTLEAYVNKVSMDRPFTQLLENKEFMTEFGTQLNAVLFKRLVVDLGMTYIEDKIQDIAQTIIDRFTSMANSEQAGTKCPVELRIQDSEGRIAGFVNGHIRQEIPMSLCCNGTIQILFQTDSYPYEIFGNGTGTYALTVTHLVDGNSTIFNADNIPICANEMHSYDLNWTMLSQAADGATVQVDSNHDGIYEYSFISSINLTRHDFVAATYKNDTGITQMARRKTIIGEGYTLPINTTVINYGAQAETLNVTLYLNQTIAVWQTVTLAGGNSTTIAFNLDTSGFAKGNYTISTYVKPLQNETYTLDNTLTGGSLIITIRGDANGDKRVNVLDLILVATHLGIHPNSPNWNGNVDLDSNSAINVLDLIICATHLGQHW